MSRVGTTGLRGRPALDTAGLTGYPIYSMNDPEVRSHRDTTDLSLPLSLPLSLTLMLSLSTVPDAAAESDPAN